MATVKLFSVARTSPTLLARAATSPVVFGGNTPQKRFASKGKYENCVLLSAKY